MRFYSSSEEKQTEQNKVYSGSALNEWSRTSAVHDLNSNELCVKNGPAAYSSRAGICGGDGRLLGQDFRIT